MGNPVQMTVSHVFADGNASKYLKSASLERK